MSCFPCRRTAKVEASPVLKTNELAGQGSVVRLWVCNPLQILCKTSGLSAKLDAKVSHITASFRPKCNMEIDRKAARKFGPLARRRSALSCADCLPRPPARQNAKCIDRYNSCAVPWYRGDVMSGQVALITGANGGLGSHVTRAFLDAGRTVAGTSRNIEQSDFAHPAFTAMVADIATARGAGGLVEQVMARFGKLDVLVHTVGGFAGGQSVVATDDATMRQMLEVNFHSLWNVLRAAIPVLRASGGGRV